MTDAERAAGSEETVEEPPVVRDRRRVDPETGELREPEHADDLADASAEADGAAAGDDEVARARAEAAERLEDLRRLQAEYVNYRRRVERDRELVRENAKAEVLAELLPVLDDIGRARDHGDLTGAFRSVGEAVESVTGKAGLERFGEPGDEFDPTVHEALMHGYADDVDVPTCTQILQPGYRVGERVIRPARVAVSEPTEALPEGGAESADPLPEPAPEAQGEQDTAADTDTRQQES
ncbi:molecular chaperone GrpE [Haloactinopolyspora alba]|uniref:Protein GrpE n=1 Tax=Haloactinopolyspora alba TaxID=648780 RepID=A0A2P8DYR4_9ACTN|nr:nucleotide exchange factor GrpE [Haloactinopolyspora alba]PSL02352.1 molecular chaperone GrpE [Haloactinopolyspora alba]